MKVKSFKVNIGYNGNRYPKGEVFECDEETGNRLIKQGTVELVEIFKPIESKKIEVPISEVQPQVKIKAIRKPEDEEEFTKVGGRWRKK